MKDYKDIKKLPFDKPLSGISEKTISIHYEKLYGGYVKKWSEISKKLESADKALANATFSDLRELKLEEGFAANAVILHEAYFDVLGGNGELPENLSKIISKDFGSFQAWLDEFKALGLSARGWVILAYDFNDGKFHNYLADMHNQGGIWGVMPVLVLDVYEHAYFADYGSDRKSYIESFFANLNWDTVLQKIEKIKF